MRRGAILILIAAVLVITVTRSFAQGTKAIHYGDSVTGTVKAGAVESWDFGGTAGEIIALSVQRTAGDLQPTLSLQDPANQPVVGTQAPTGGDSAALMQVRLTQTGDYMIQIGGVGQTAGDYKLSLTLTAPVAPTATALPTQEPHEIAGVVNAGDTVSGEITGQIYRQLWHFTGNSGDVVDISMKATSRNLDSFLALLSPTNDTIASNDSATGGLDAGILGFELPFTGTYTIIARRAGQSNGQGANTTGTYTLTVTSRGVGTAAKNTTLNLDTPVIGRLTDSAPLALYRLEIGGPTAFQLDLAQLHRLASLRIMTTSSVVIASYQGLSPLRVALTLPLQKGPYIIETSALDYDIMPTSDFSLTAFHLSATFNDVQTLAYGERHHANAQRWYFIGQAGDLATLSLTPDTGDTSALTAPVTVTAPGDTTLLIGTLGAGLQHTLALPTTGAYEIEIGSGTTNYTLALNRAGAAGITFDQFTLALDKGALALTTPTTGTLAKNAVDAWTFDATAGQVVSLIAQPMTNQELLALSIQRPDGSLLTTQISERLAGAVIDSQPLDQPGRYRVLVYDPTGQGGNYTLHYEDAGGGTLKTGEAVKGIVSPANGFASWDLNNVPAGVLINVKLTTLTPNAWTPSISIADPGGNIIGTSTLGQNASEGNLLGIAAPIAGSYHILIAGVVSNPFASYQVLTNIESPFGASTTAPIKVDSTNTPLIRYAPPPTPNIIKLNVSDLIDPAIPTVKIQSSSNLPIAMDSTVRGEITAGSLFQVWRFGVGSDAAFTIRATTLTHTGPGLMLIDQKGKIVADQRRASDPTTALTYRSQTGGTYEIVVRMGFDGGRYLLSLETANPQHGALTVSDGIPIAYGQTVAGELYDHNDVYYFMGTNSDAVSARLTATGGDLQPTIQIIAPGGKTFGDKNVTSLDDVHLLETGIYALVVGKNSSAQTSTGRYSLTLTTSSSTRIRKRGGGIIERSGTVAGLLNPDNRQDTWLFRAQSGERVTFMAAANGDPLLAPLSLTLEDTNGGIIAAQTLTTTQSAIKIADVMLPSDGIYRAVVQGGNLTAGIYNLTWQPETEHLTAGPIVYGQTAGGVFTAANKLETWYFAGTAGDVISAALHYERGDKFNGGFQILTETGAPLATQADPGDGSGARIDSLTLPVSGIYRVLVANPDSNFKGTGVYSLSIGLQDSKARSIGGILHYGNAAQTGFGEIYTDDPSDSWLINAHGGDTLTLTAAARDQFLKPHIELRSTAGVVIASADAGPQDTSASIQEFVFQVDGTYSITVTGGAAKTTGSYALLLTQKIKQTAENTLNYGDTKKGLIAQDRPAESWGFTGKAGDSVTATITRASGTRLFSVVELRDLKTGITLAHSDGGNADSATISNYQLPYTGQFAVIATRFRGAAGISTGTYTVTLNGSPDATPVKGEIHLGLKAIGRLSDQEPADRWTFKAKKNSVVGITSKATSGDLDTVLVVEDSNGNVLARNDDFDGTNAVIAGVLLTNTDANPAATTTPTLVATSAATAAATAGANSTSNDAGDIGTYTVTISRVGTNTVGTVGNYDLQADLLYQISPVKPTALITYGGRVVSSVDTAAPEQDYTFSGLQNDEIAIQLIHQTDDAPPLLSIEDPSGATLATGKLNVGATTINGYHLPTSGLYTIAVKRPINTRLPYSPFALTLNLVSSQANGNSDGGVVLVGDTVIGVFAPGETTNYWLFQGKAQSSLNASLVKLTGDLRLSALLIAPNGQTIASADSAALINDVPLPSDGVYSLLIIGSGSGQYRLTLASTSDPKAPLPITPGQTVSGSLDAVHPQAGWRFTGTKGKSISARMLATDSGFTPDLKLLDANGAVIAAGSLDRGASGGQVSSALSVVIPNDGSYTLITSSANGQAGNYRLSLELGALSAEAVAAQPVAYGNPVRGVVQGGSVDLWAFNAAANDTVSIAVLALDGKTPGLELHDAGGQVLAKADSRNDSETHLTSYTLPSDGRYIVALPASTTGSYSMTVNRRQNLLQHTAISRILVSGQPQENGITPDGSVDYWTFNAKAGDALQIDGVRLNGDLRVDLALYDPASGFLVAGIGDPDTGKASLGPIKLPQTGAYQLVVTRWLKTSGRYRLVMSQPATAPSTPTLTPTAAAKIDFQTAITNAVGIGYGAAQNGDVTTDNPIRGFVFLGKSGEQISLDLAGEGQLTAYLLAPDGSVLVSGQNIKNISLPNDGLYGVVISGTGKFGLTVQRNQLGAVYQGTVTVGARMQGVTTSNAPIQGWTFDVNDGASTTIAATLQSQTAGFNAVVTIADGNGQALATSSATKDGLASVETVLPGSGHYAVIVSAQTAGTFTVDLGYALSPTGGGVLIPRQTVNGMISDADFSDTWRIKLASGTKLTLSAQADSLALSLVIFAPDGSVLGQQDGKSGEPVNLSATTSTDGVYTVIISRVGGAAGYGSGSYTLTAQ